MHPRKVLDTPKKLNMGSAHARFIAYDVQPTGIQENQGLFRAAIPPEGPIVYEGANQQGMIQPEPVL